MRDHPHHGTQILGGMFGARNNVLHPFKNVFNNYAKNSDRGYDQQFLGNIIYPYVIKISLIHASYCKYEHNTRDFPKSNYQSFVGAYDRTAPRTFAILNEENRLLNTMFSYQNMC